MTRRPHDPQFVHDIPAVVTPQDCRHLFLLESQVGGFVFPGVTQRCPVVVVGGIRVPIVWDQAAWNDDFVCTPVSDD